MRESTARSAVKPRFSAFEPARAGDAAIPSAPGATDSATAASRASPVDTTSVGRGPNRGVRGEPRARVRRAAGDPADPEDRPRGGGARRAPTELVLNRGVGHIAGTPLPGEEGNIGIAGHRDGYFRGLKDVVEGDLIEIETLTGSRELHHHRALPRRPTRCLGPRTHRESRRSPWSPAIRSTSSEAPRSAISSERRHGEPWTRRRIDRVPHSFCVSTDNNYRSMR